jgi:predicted NAD/FAD-binding protein
MEAAVIGAGIGGLTAARGWLFDYDAEMETSP